MDNLTDMSPEEIAELEREEQEREEQEREEQKAQALRELLSSFSADTVFYSEIIVDGDVQKLGGWTKDAQAAYVNGWLDNHMTEDELTYVPSSAYAGVYYIKGHEKPAETPEEFIARREEEIKAVVQTLIDETAHQKEYDDGVSCTSYVGDPDPEFDAQARAFLAWRGRCWRTCYNILNSVIAGTVSPEDVTNEYVIERLPTMEWPENE